MDSENSLNVLPSLRAHVSWPNELYFKIKISIPPLLVKDVSQKSIDDEKYPDK